MVYLCTLDPAPPILDPAPLQLGVALPDDDEEMSKFIEPYRARLTQADWKDFAEIVPDMKCLE